MNALQYNIALKNRFRVIYGAQTEMEVELCVSTTTLAAALIFVVEEGFRTKAIGAFASHLGHLLSISSTPPQRTISLLEATLEEIKAAAEANIADVEAARDSL